MKILIIGVARCGTTTLTNALSEIFNLKPIIEPWNRMYETNLDNLDTFEFGDNIVLKITVEQTPESIKDYDGFIKEYVKDFDKIILLGRLDLDACSKSMIHQLKHSKENPENWHKPYVYDKETIDNMDLELTQAAVAMWMEKLNEISEYLNKPITWYEYLYSGNRDYIQECIDSWQLEIDVDDLLKFVNPSRRYRRFN